ncbi:Detected protein of unknown function [Hibiscus syriacus]|uniref:histidine kinase n=1 Tax=Hibiscus syriacus TaxID=106335 RepID=A0A6A2YEH9_HIBSY|nr:Detected protein of unknown function [Hibiscus syriacus]
MKLSLQIASRPVTVLIVLMMNPNGAQNVSCTTPESHIMYIGEKEYSVSCSAVEISGVQSFGFSNNCVSGDCTCVFITSMGNTAQREVFLHDKLIKQVEATQQAERKSMNKSLALPPGSDFESYLKQMSHCAQALLGLLNSILDTSKIEAGMMNLVEQEFNLADLVEHVDDLYHPVGMIKGVDVVLDSCDGSIIKLTLVKSDRGKLMQILSNVLSNAVKFTDEGHVCLRAWVRKPDFETGILSSSLNGFHKYLSRLFNDNNETNGDVKAISAVMQNPDSVEIMFKVDDTGKGIPKEKQKSVFENYVQVKETEAGQEGTGLGLGIFQSLVRLMSGEIGVVDKEIGEKGTSFRFNVFLTCEISSSGNLKGDKETQGSSLYAKQGKAKSFTQKIMQGLGISVSVVDQCNYLPSALKKIQLKLNSDYHSSRRSDMSHRSDNSSLSSKDVPLSAMEGTDHKLHRRHDTPSFILLVVDVNAGPFSELWRIVIEFRRGLHSTCGKVVWLDKPTVGMITPIRLDPGDEVLLQPFHGSLLHRVIKLLPEFGGEQERAELLLQSLPDSYDQLIINLTNSNVTNLVFDDVATAVLQEENRCKNNENRQVNLQQAEALTTMTMMRGRSTERGQSSSHKHSRSKSRSKKNLKCYNCGKKSHLKKDCWSLNKNSNPQGNTTNTSDDGDALYCETSTTVEGRKRFTDIWLIDSGATYHMTSRREWFHHYEHASGGSVYSCNDHALEIVGVGTIKLKMYDGTIKVVRDVRHVKGLKKNLLSYGLLDNNASKIETQKGIMKVFRGALVVMKGEKIATNLYMLKGETLLEAEASVASCLTKVSLTLCEHCITSKQHRLKFNTSNSRGKSVLELVHSDVWQAPVTSLGGAKYFVSFIDDYSRRCWVYPIKKKSDVFSTFKNFKARVELDSGNKIKKCKFLGYADGVKGYRLWDPTARKVIISRDIHVEKEFEQGGDSSKVEPAHDEQEPESSEAPTTQDGEPSTYQEAINNSDASLWMMAMKEEIEALHKNNTWDFVPLPQGRKPIGNKWVFKIKRNGDDQVERYRARLVVKGYAQKEEQLDVKTTFLHGNLEEEIYMLQPEGFEEKEKKNLVCKLNKSLYSLKQAPRCWYKRFDSFIICLGYNRLNAEPCAYFKRSGDNDFVILLLYVDDMLVAGPNKDHIEELKAQLAREFEMKDLGSTNKILGMQIHRDRSNRKIWLSQKNYLKKILSRFNMQDCKPISTPLPINFKLSFSMSPSSKEERMEMSRVLYASTVRSLMFAMICTRPDISQAVGVVSRYMENPGKEHWNTLIVATSTTEAEYVAATQASKETIWLKMLLEELGHNQEYVSLFCDSQSALHLARNPAFHSRIKHIRVQYHFIRDKVEEGTVDMQKIHTKDNIADFMMKAINADKFTWCRSFCGLSETNGLPYDYILMDCQMLPMNDYEATRRIRTEEKYGIRLLINALTAHTSGEEAMEAGMDVHLVKPLKSNELMKVIEKIQKKKSG